MNLKKLADVSYKTLTDNKYRTKLLANLGFYDRMDDEKYLKKLYMANFGKELDLENPKTFNEKLQWLKLYDRKPEYTMMVDKYKVREYIAEKLGEEYLIPLLGVWDDPEEIDFDKLPDQFVLKCNHNSGLGMCICKDKSKLDIKKVKSELRKGLKQDYYLHGREWPYKDVPRKIICEKYMTDSSKTDDFTDYKFFCFNGKVDSVMLCLERQTGNPKFYFFDKEWKLCRYNKLGKAMPAQFSVPKPDNVIKMFEIASELSKKLPFVRIDLYNAGGHIYFGEITFFPDSGFDYNLLPETDKYFGSLINLEDINFEDNRISDKS